MTYVKVSIPRNDEGGAATIKQATVILVDVDDVKTEPSRTLGDATVTGDLELVTGAKAVGIYATPSTIELTQEQQGDVDSRSTIKGVGYTHPGDSKAVAGFSEAYRNKGVIAIVRECDGSANGRARIVGSKCNPLYLEQEYTNNNEAARRRHTWKQAQGDKFDIAFYEGAIPALADEASASATEETSA